MDRQHTIAVSLEAKSRSELSSKMFLNNVKFNCFFKYFDFQKDGKRWICWYYADIFTQIDKSKKQIKIEKRVK